VIMIKEKKTFQQLTSNDVCLVYELLRKDGLVSFPLMLENRNKVDSLVGSINSSHYGTEIYVTSEEKAVAYLFFVIKSHPFTDGNKRTACIVFEIACAINDLHPNYKDSALDEYAVFIEKIKEEDHQETIKTLAKALFNG
jgi:prophage maintenance system killer protein